MVSLHCRKSNAYLIVEYTQSRSLRYRTYELTDSTSCFPSGESVLVTMSWLYYVREVKTAEAFYNSHLSADGVQLTIIATKICTFDSGFTRSPVIRARVTKNPMTGMITSFKTQTDSRAEIGRPNFGFSLTSIRANDTPKRNNVIGTVIAPISWAFRGQ